MLHPAASSTATLLFGRILPAGGLHVVAALAVRRQ
jgi:hypothetical protein